MNKKQVWYLIAMLISAFVSAYFLHLIRKEGKILMLYTIMFSCFFLAIVFFWEMILREYKNCRKTARERTNLIKLLKEEPPIISGHENETKIERVKPPIRIDFNDLDEELQQEFNEWYGKVKTNIKGEITTTPYNLLTEAQKKEIDEWLNNAERMRKYHKHILGIRKDDKKD